MKYTTEQAEYLKKNNQNAFIKGKKIKINQGVEKDGFIIFESKINKLEL